MPKKILMSQPAETPFVCIFHDFDDSPEARFETEASDAQEAAVRAVGWWEEQIEVYSVLEGEETLRIRVHGAEGVSVWEVFGVQGSYVARAMQDCDVPVRIVKPGKRLVDWKQYLVNMTRKIGNHTMAGILLAFGVLFVGTTLAIIGYCLSVIEHAIIEEVMFPAFIGFITGSVAVSCFLHSADQRRKGSAIEAGKPITRHNAHLLPAVETLVRASDMPPSHQQAELLRGVATPGSATPPEEMVRASGTTGQEG